jgi:hypothetical protein
LETFRFSSDLSPLQKVSNTLDLSSWAIWPTKWILVMLVHPKKTKQWGCTTTWEFQMQSRQPTLNKANIPRHTHQFCIMGSWSVGLDQKEYEETSSVPHQEHPKYTTDQ